MNEKQRENQEERETDPSTFDCTTKSKYGCFIMGTFCSVLMPFFSGAAWPSQL